MAEEKGMFYLVATPIGNLSDISFRAIETLKSADIILCEDTRDSQKFLNHYGIKKPLESYHKFNYKKVIPSIVSRLKEGLNFALITDAGTPGISDPGREILSELADGGIKYTVIPGACAFVNAFVLSGFPLPMTFAGFLPAGNRERNKLLDELKTYRSTLIFYSSPHSLKEDIKILFEKFGNRKCASVRELTKIYEEVEHFDLEKGYPKEPRGEYVLLVEGAVSEIEELNNLPVAQHYNYYLKLKFSKSDAIKQVAKDRGVAKNIIYSQIVNDKQ